jgi:MoaA/NifB/PqqE/SkfB family radical SAM enzyme
MEMANSRPSGSIIEGANVLRLARRLLSARVLHRYRPLLVNIETTLRCNLQCDFCDKKSPHGPQMDTERACRLIDELADAGTCSVCFDGGEPLLHPGIGDIIAHARRRDLRVALSTNGTLIPQRPDAWKQANVIKISLDGAEKQHDAGRGLGAFCRAHAGARLAREHGKQVMLRMTIGAHNVDSWPQALAIAKDLDCPILFQPAVGSILDGNIAFAPHSADVQRYREAFHGIIKAQQQGEPVANDWLCLDYLRRWPDPQPVPFCAGGRIQAAIDPDGNMFPCGRSGRTSSAPNVFRQGVRAAFAELARPVDCQNCWCTLTLATCFLWRLDPRLLKRRFQFAPARRLPRALARRAASPSAASMQVAK